jgi:lysophospholipase L1-like esterase
MAMVVPGGGGNVVGPTGNGGSVVGNGGTGMAGSMQLGVGGGMPMSAGGTGNGGAAGGGGMPMGGAAGEGAGGAAGGGGMGGAPFKPPCLKKPSEVVFLGDSYVNYIIAHPELNGLVAQRAVMDGALMTGQNYRDYAVAGATMAATSANMIPPQWPQAKADPDIQTVIMTGGGNDVLINNPQCKAAGAQNDATCKQVVANTVMVVGNLIADFQKTGVTDLIYFFYPHVPAGGADIADYAFIQLQNSAKLLSTDKFRMQVIDLVPLFNGHADYVFADGIHANATGEGVIADAIYKMMKDSCIAQPASKGCCVP